MKAINLIIILVFSTILSFGQAKERLKGKPKTLEETFIYLDNILDDTSKYTFMMLPEDVGTSRLHFGLGMWIRNNWGLWRNSELKHYFIDRGVHHPDNMSGIILTSYHRYLNNQPIEFLEQNKKYQNWNDKHEQSGFSLDDISRGTTTDSALLTYFPVGDTILVYVSGEYKRFSLRDLWINTYYDKIETLAIVQEHKSNKLLTKLIKINNPKERKVTDKVGDVLELSPYYCYLIPPRNWTINKVK